MKATFKQRLLLFFLPPLAAWLMRLLAVTWRFREKGAATLSVTRPQPEPRIYVYWHECVLPAVGLYRDQPIHPFASQSFDGELISRAMHRLGLGPCARGSSSRGGAQGLLEMKKFLDQGRHVSITVDGPRGPRRKAQLGAVKLAQLSGRALVPFHILPRPALRLRSWDRMLLPLPFLRGGVYFGEAMGVPRDGDPETSLKALQTALERVCLEAEERSDQ
jgi:lysophospholipid acyltransferase (LPLAT)-like uncharacterized protein